MPGHGGAASTGEHNNNNCRGLIRKSDVILILNSKYQREKTLDVMYFGDRCLTVSNLPLVFGRKIALTSNKLRRLFLLSHSKGTIGFPALDLHVDL